jgi:hypothetical protein
MTVGQALRAERLLNQANNQQKPTSNPTIHQAIKQSNKPTTPQPLNE